MAPNIVSNRRQLHNRFPTLSFTVTVQSRELTHCEVLLATDATLFHPNNASRRQPHNFYASRQDSGLIEFVNGEAVYVVPVPVLKAFVQAEPRPTAIFYTAVASSDNQGTNPQFAHDPATLASEAPSVGIAADFQAQTLSAVLGIATNKLRRVGGRGYDVRAQSFSASADDDYPEDGYMMSPPETANDTVSAASYYHPFSSDNDPDLEPQDGYEAQYQAPNGNGGEIAPSSQSFSSDDFMEDGYSYYNQPNGGDVMAGEQSWPRAQESVYPYGASEPKTLMDEDYLYDDGYDEDDIYEDYNGGDNGDNGLTSSSSAYHDNDFDYEDGYGDEDYAASHAYDDYAQAAPDYDDGYEYDDIYENYEDPPAYQSLNTYALSAQPLTIEDRKDIIDHIAKFESNNDYDRINADGEFEGKFGPNHSAYQKYHIGLSYGYVQFTQDGGNLGRLLVMMRNRDHAAFNRIFGEHADDLIRVTTASGPSSRHTESGRSARVQPVGGADLWKEPWLSRFREAGRYDPFKSAQNEAASTFYLDPILTFAGWLGLNTDRALTIVADRSVQLGPAGSRRWISGVVGPIKTSAQRQQALQALGYRDLRAFQQVTHGLNVDGDWGPYSHAAMVVALRQLGDASPVAIPSREQMIDMMVRQSRSRAWGHRVRKLRDNEDFNDTEFELVTAEHMPRPATTTP